MTSRTCVKLVVAIELVLELVPPARAAVPPALFKKFKLQTVHDRLPDFALLTDHGPNATLTSLLHRPTVLHFWASWCTPCQKELPALAQLVKANSGDGGIQFMAISVDRPADQKKAAEILGRIEPSLRFFATPDPERSPGQALWAWGVPLTYFIDAHKNFIARAIGPRDWAALTHSELQSLFGLNPAP